MDKRLAEFIDRDTPPLNPDLANGLAVKQMAKAEEYLDSVFRAASKSFPEGLEYVGCTPTTPMEEYTRVTAGRKNNKRSFNIAQSDTYMVKFNLRFEGENLPPRFVSLPYVRDGGYIMLKGAQHAISPVLKDIIFSVTKNAIFVSPLQAKINFYRIPHSFVVQGSGTDTVQIVWAVIHNKPGTPMMRAKHTMMHYLMAKYGFDESFKRFASCVPVMGYDEINPETYPPDQWVICHSIGKAPRICRRSSWVSSGIRIAVPRDAYTNDPMMRPMIAGFFYVLDHFPDRIKPEWRNSERLWRVLLGHLIYAAGESHGKLYDNITDHIRSLDKYMDSFIVKRLHSMGHDINDIYQLMALIMEKFNEWFRESGKKINSMYDKELSVLNYMLMDITKSIFYSIYALNQRLSTRKKITASDVTDTFDRYLTYNIITHVTKEQRCIDPLSIPNDSKSLRLTTMLVPQSSNDAKKRRRLSFDDPAIKFHTSIAEVGGYTYLPKTNPDGRSRLNHHVMLSDDYRILRNPRFKELLDQTEAALHEVRNSRDQ